MSLFTRMSSIFKGLFFRKPPTKRELQERRDSYMIILTLLHRKLRMERLSQQYQRPLDGESSYFSSTLAHLSSSSDLETALDLHSSKNEMNMTESRPDIEQFIDVASDQMLTQNNNIHDLSITGLRQEIQGLLQPDILRIFQGFRTVDNLLLSSPLSSSTSPPLIDHADQNDNVYKNALLNEYDRVCDALFHAEANERQQLEREHNNDTDPNNDNHPNTTRRPSPVPYLQRKKGALQSIATSMGWSVANHHHDDGHNDNNTVEFLTEHNMEDDDNNKDNVELPNKVIGSYSNRTENEDIVRDMQRRRLIHMIKSILLRTELGYSVLTLQSTIPNAGRGIFVDGTARAGSIVAFFPGYVWPKEYLLNPSIVASNFTNDPHYQLSLRYDDILIDSRGEEEEGGVTLKRERLNPWSVAHLANHPSPPLLQRPNCRTVMINYTDEITKLGLDKYIPNRYARQPPLLGVKALERDDIIMHGFGLITARDVENEELVYDYKLRPDDGGGGGGGGKESYPDWYHVCDEEEFENVRES